MFRQYTADALAPIIVSVVLGIAGAILVESSLSFLGIGVPAHWHLGVDSARSQQHDVCLVGGRVSRLRDLHYGARYYLVGEGLREVLDPRLRGLR